MPEEKEILKLLVEIRDNQLKSLQRQEQHLAIAREQLERSRKQVDASMQLQRKALQGARKVGWLAVAALVFCIVMILYLVLRCF